MNPSTSIFLIPHKIAADLFGSGNRANEGYAEMTVIVWNPDGSAYFTYSKPEISDNNNWRAGGLDVKNYNAGRKGKNYFYRESCCTCRIPEICRTPGRAFKRKSHDSDCR